MYGSVEEQGIAEGGSRLPDSYTQGETMDLTQPLQHAMRLSAHYPTPVGVWEC